MASRFSLWRCLLAGLAVWLAMPGVGLIRSGYAVAQESQRTKTVDGLTVYLGIVPAEIVKGLTATGGTERQMHGGTPKGIHEYHLVAAVFEAGSAKRVSDASVTAEVAGLGLSGSKMKLDPMRIGDTTTYGGFFNLPGFDLYSIKLTVERAGAKPAAFIFQYDHKR